MSRPIRVQRLIRDRMERIAIEEGEPISEREAARRCGIPSPRWIYYVKRDRKDVTPLWVLRRISEGLRIPLEQLQTAALRDAGWHVRVLRDEPEIHEVAVEGPDGEPDS